MPRHHNNINTTGQTSWWSTAFSPPGMAEINRQPMDNTMHTRLPLRADRDPTRELPCALSSEATRAEQSPRERGSGSPSKGCDRANNKVRFLQPNVCSPQERRGVASHYQPQEVECVPLSLSLQDGEYQQCEGRYSGERLHGEDRPERCLPDGSSLGEAPQISQVYMGWPVLPVQVPTLWPGHSTQNLHKTPTTSGRGDEEKGSSPGHVPRRYPCDGTDQGGSERTSESNGIGPPVSRIHPEPAEVCLGANSENRIPGVYCGLRDSDDLSSRGQVIQNSEGVQEHEQQGQSNRSPTGTGNRLAIIGNTSNSTSTPALSSPSETEKPGSTTVTRELRICYPSQHRGTERSALVDTRCTSLQWSPHPCTNSRPSDNLGCLQDRLGSDMPGDTHRRSMGSPGKSRTHQPPGTQSSFPSIADLCLSSFRTTHPTSDRQHNSYRLHKPQGRYAISDPVRSGDRALGVVLSEEDSCARRAYPRTEECRSRCRIAESIGPERLDVEPGDLSSSGDEVGSIRCRPIRSKAQQTAEEIFQFQARPRSRSSRCTSPAMVEHQIICISPIHSHREMLAEDSPRGSPGDSDDCTRLAGTTLVSSLNREPDRPSNTATANPQSPRQSGRGPTPPGSEEPTLPGRMETVWSAVQNQGISREAFQIICSSWRRGTEKAYSSTWGKWSRWCSQRQTDPFPRSVGPIIEFLTMKFKEGMQYSTMNSYRSALSATLPPIEGHPVGQHPLVCRLLQGMFNQRPPAPRYQSVWNVGVVIRHIQSQSQLTDLPLKEVSKRLVVLLALSNASRSSDLHALDLRFRQFTPEGVTFRIPGLTKTRRSGPPKEAFFAKFADDEALCPVKTLKVYEERTTMLRAVDPTEPAPLLISFRKPHKPVSSASIARWMKELLKEAGVDTEVFKAHSTRAASTSTAKAQGVSMADIMNMAGWSRQSTFERFYYKSIQNDDYARAVLSTSTQSSKSLNHTLSYTKPCHDVELIISQGSEGSDVRLEFHEWQGEYMTVSHP